MNKPNSVIIEESKQQIIDVINNTGLSAYILEMILKDIYTEVKQLSERQYMTEKMEYEKYLQEHKESTSTE